MPLDLGATPVTGMHVSTVYKLRQALGLDRPYEPVRVINIYEMLGEIQLDLIEALGGDVIGLERPTNSFGIPNQGWKEWRTFDGTPVLVPGGFNTATEANGDLLIYPKGDQSGSASGRMPKDGYYFDIIPRHSDVQVELAKVEENIEEFIPLSKSEIDFFQNRVQELCLKTDKAIIANIGGTGFGDVAQVPGPQLKNPAGIRDIEEWYISVLTRQDFVHQIFEHQCNIALDNLARFYQAVGDQIDILFMSGTDFGGQQRLLFSPRIYRQLFKPYQKRLNDWVHANTSWKIFMHTDGAVMELIADFIDAGFDILNPVQWTATGMDLNLLKKEFGDNVVFWGAGVDTQGTLPFGSPEDVRQEVGRLIDIFKPGGGFVFSSVHNIQAKVPIDNVLAFYHTFNQGRNYT